MVTRFRDRPVMTASIPLHIKFRPPRTRRPERKWRRHPDLNRSNRGFAVRCLTTWLWRHWSGQRDSNSLPPPWQGGALPNELRPQILPQRGRWCLRPESNWRHADFQSAALPTELPRHMATRNGLEPSTSSVTGWRSKPTELPGRMVGTTGLEPVTPCL